MRVLLLSLALIGTAAPAQDAPGALARDDALTCTQIADQLMALTGGVTANVARAQEMAASGAPDMVGQTIAGQALGAVASVIPGPAASIVGGAAAQVQAANAERQRKEAPKKQAELDALEAPRMAGLDRMLHLHELHQARCAATPAKQ
ncbi:hypothetical protein IC614_07520 [Allosphingosinicella flava]|uniref:Uncharacterized protein n=1 Tax=Allosphingosinicella flava TaxID=2771430 RepID=A0A7T2GI03_9SPHN|nr:hypothetical protein [Sphingosinicella flava]QPQ54214.1 hypothetical protein IC614_07520 [Sphingosinicella flava]